MIEFIKEMPQLFWIVVFCISLLVLCAWTAPRAKDDDAQFVEDQLESGKDEAFNKMNDGIINQLQEGNSVYLPPSAEDLPASAKEASPPEPELVPVEEVTAKDVKKTVRKATKQAKKTTKKRKTKARNLSDWQ
jgi:hypothetical protein